METSKLKKFAQYARRNLMEQVTSKLALVLESDSQARRESSKAVTELEKKIAVMGKEQVVEQVAYTWFNRFCALRFMDVNNYNRIGVISPVEGQFQPEILAEAKAGHIDEGIVNESTSNKIFALLDGTLKSRDVQSEVYRLLIVAVCNDYHRIMPYLFERIKDYTELLMPDDLLSDNSILAYTREAMTPEACSSVESIGWLYQFYISEKKDQVFEGLKKNKKITPKNIPAATQLFTPHWIVRYLVENSLGRLWMLNNPDSKVIEQMDYYIKPVEQETDFLKIESPEEIKICDPACGSGHMLTYAYDLLYAIYLDAGYDSTEIPEKILANNLYGIEIDERAAELAAFALSMKAIKGNPLDDGNNRRRFFRDPIKPNICRLEKIAFTDEELDNYIDFIGRDLFTADLRATLKEFEEADNFGSLIQPTLKSPEDALVVLETKDVSDQLFLSETHKSVLQVLEQADYLSPKYNVVIANPPYMGGGGMNGRLKVWAQDNFADSKADMFAMFIERGLEMVPKRGYSAMVTMQSWMFISSYEKLRSKLLAKTTIESLCHMANMVMGIAFGTSATVWKKDTARDQSGAFCFVEYGDIGKNNKPVKFPPDNPRNSNSKKNGFFCVSAADIEKISGKPIAYWVSDPFREIFSKPPLSEYFQTRLGLSTANNDRFLRNWQEVSINEIGFDFGNRDEAKESKLKWFPYEKGGAFRKWYGNHDFLVNWQNDGGEVRNFGKEEGRIRSHNYNLDYIFKEGITWSDVTSGTNAFRFMPEGFLFDGRGSSGFVYQRNLLNRIFGFLNSKVSTYAISAINPTVAINVGEIAKLPFPDLGREAGIQVDEIVSLLTLTHRINWDSYETSWDFTSLSLLNPDYRQPALKTTYQELNSYWRETTLEMQRLEEENNRIFIDAYGLQDELTPDVSLNEITLTCNPHYRYNGNKNEEELEVQLLKDTVQELLSYSVGCMFGRYSLDKEGLILANQGETLEDYLKQIPKPSFTPDDDNVIPLIDFEGDWFEDDISERFKEFLKTTFGQEHFSENLEFIEEAIGKDIKKYFLKDFYTDHVKRYKKRPIYWLFSSPKGSFNALIYMHRYRPDTVSIVLNDYLREFRTKLIARKESYEQIELSASASQREKTQAIKAVAKINKVIDEVNDYEREVLYPLAGKNIEIDLDDGVKHNYPLFGKALKKVAGLS